ncbi:MAG: hypothetical protein ABI353_23540 [Isosphaeraceae bacterium]
MKGLVFLVHWDPPTALERAETLREAEWDVATESRDGRRGYKAILDQRPLAVVIDLSIRPTHGRELARSLKKTKPTRSLPVVFVGGSPREDAKVRAELPGALFSTLDGLAATLDQATRAETPEDLG